MYKTIQGDTWDIISKKYYSSENHIDILMQANSKHIDTVIFSAGIELTIPDLPEETKKADNLPSWRD